MRKAEVPDKKIANLLKNPSNKEKAFSLLVKKYQERLYWHIRKMVISHDDTDDILQNTFIKTWKGLDKFRGDASLYTWLYRIATNETLTFLKNKDKRNAVSLNNENVIPENRLRSDSGFNGNEIQLKLQKYILMLPDKQRLVFNMKYFDEMKYEDIAKITGNSVGALKASFHHAVNKLKSMFKNDEII
ncbi:MAG: RNA polymerase sigma factor [Chlorobi bacterium]|nr:RNA polymerase sigma factor [Chlorobiota bacterium]